MPPSLSLKISLFWYPDLKIFRVESVKNATFLRKICQKCQFFALNL